MTMPSSLIYSIIAKKENAHDEHIYCCDWVKSSTAGDSANASKEFIVTGGLDGLVKVWIYQDNRLELLYSLEGHLMAVVSVAISPSASTLVSASLDSNLILWNLSSGKKITEVPTGESDVWILAYSPDGEQIITGGHTGKIFMYGVNDGAICRVMDTKGKFILSIDSSPDGKYIAAGLDEGVLCILDVHQDLNLHTIRAHSQPIRSVAFSPCSKRVASASVDGLVKIYAFTVSNAVHVGTLEHKCWATSVCFSPDGTRIATGAADGRVRVAAARDLRLLHTFEEHTDTHMLQNAISCDDVIDCLCMRKCLRGALLERFINLRYPKDEDLRKQWIANLRRINWQPYTNSVLC